MRLAYGVLVVCFLAIAALIYFCYQDHLKWLDYKKEFNCHETGEQRMETYIYFITVNNTLLPQQGINIYNQYYCELNKQYVWR